MSRRERRTSGARKSSADESPYLSPRDRKKASNADSDDNTPMRGGRQKTPSSADQKKPAKKAPVIEEEEDGDIDDDRSIKKKSKKTTPVGKLKKSAESEKKEKLIADDADGEMDDEDIAGGRKAATGTNSSSSASSSKPAVRTGLDIELLNQLLRGVPDNFFRKDNFNPFNHWNDDRNKLSEWRAQTERAVDHIIDIYFKGFNMSISSFSSVLKSFSASQSLTNDLSDALVKSKRYLQNTNLSLRELWGATVTAKKVVEICDKVEYIRSVPSQFDSYVRKKQFVHSVRLLSSAIFLLTGEDLCEIEGLKEIREELLMKRNELQALLMEEIINIIYLKGLKNRLDGKNFREEDDDELLLSVQRKRGHSSRESSLRESPANSFKEVSNASFSSFTSNKNLSATPHNPAGVGIISRGSFSRRSIRGDSTTPSNSSMGGMGSVGVGHSWRPEESQFSPFSVKKDNNDRGSSNSFSSSPSLRLSYSDSRSNSLINELLIEEKSDSYLHNPTGNTSRFLCLCTEALNEMNAIPALRTQIWKRMRGEIKELIDNQAARIKEKAEKLKARRRVLGQTDSYQGGGGSSSAPSTPMLSSTQSAYEKEDADLLLELFDSIFQLLTGVLKSHIEVSSLITSRLGQGMDEKEKKETILATTPPGASGFMKGSGSGASEVTAVWEVMQIQLQVLFCDYLQARGETINVNNSAAKARRKAGLAALEELSFSFEENSIPSIAKMSRNVKKEELKRRGVFIDPSESSPTSTVVSSSTISFLNGTPYNITQIYRPVIQFIDQAVSMIGASQSSTAIGMLSSSPSSSSEVQLRQFLKVFIETSFLPRVQADVNRRLDEILNDSTAFDPREIERDQRNQLGALSSLSSSSSNPSSIDNDIQLSSQLLLKSVQEVADLLKRLFSDMLLLPHSVNEYVAIVERLVMRTAEKCSERMNELTKKTFSAQRLADPKVYSLLQSDPLFKCLTNGDWKNAYEDPKVDSFFSDANPLYNEFYKKEWILKKDQLLFDPKSIGALALICESMEWMADKLFQLTDPFYGASSASKRYANPPRALFAPRSGRGGAGVNQSSNNAARFGSFRWVSRNNDRFGPSRLSSKSLLEQKRYGLAENFLQLADRCLFMLRFELHSHYFYFLKEMLHGQYYCANDSMEPEGWVLDFNKDLTSFDDALTKYLSSDKKKYVLGGSFPLISSIIIRSIPLLHDRRVNKKGVSKLTRNCFALQQNLTNILFSQEYTGAAHFDRARQYLELLNYSDEDLHLFQLDNPDMFSQEEYIAIQSIHTPIRLANTINHTQTN